MMTGEEYRKSVVDGRRTFFEGEEVPDVNAHRILGIGATTVAEAYDKFHNPDPGAVNPLLSAPKTLDDLRERTSILSAAHDTLTTTTYQSLATLLTAAPTVAQTRPEYVERMMHFHDRCLVEDWRVTECITDAKGNRGLPPSRQPDPDSFVRVIERKSDGIIINGAKLHITGASFGHYLMVMPTKNMKAGEEDYAVAAAVPVNAPGVKIINTTPAPRGEETRQFPFSRGHVMPDGFVILDNVFVPYENVFLDGEGSYAATFAHSLGLWERLGSTAAMADLADTLVGLAQLIAEANGNAGIPHIKDKIAEMIINATMIRGCLEAAMAHSRITPDGFIFPDELYTNAAKYHGAINFHIMVRSLHDIGGGAIVTAPSVADLENTELRPFIQKYMATDTKNGEWRTLLFHGIRDLTADSYGGWHLVTELQAGGGLFAQRTVTRKHYDMDKAKTMALQQIGLDPSMAPQ
jgi:4-hydroxybutyryl-CoA dehydratase/vinylacetyl-CoA-Delta-isomerase